MNDLIRAALKRGVRGSESHVDPAAVLDGLEYRFAGLFPTAIPNTIWQIAEHMHLWVRFKVEMFEGKHIVHPEGHGFGDDIAPASEEAWEAFKVEYKTAILRIEKLVETLDLEKHWPDWSNLTTMEIVVMMSNHNSYHSAQIVAMRRVLGVWNR